MSHEKFQDSKKIGGRCFISTYRRTDHLGDICKREMINVKLIPESETKIFQKNTRSKNLGTIDTRGDLKLPLTAPLITAWVYELAFALTTGIHCVIFQRNGNMYIIFV